MKLLSSLEAQLILLSTAASFLANVGATPLPLFGTETGAVSRALAPRQVGAPSLREPVNFNYVRDIRVTDPSHLVVAAKSSDSLITHDSTVPLNRPDKVSVVEFGTRRPSLEVVGNPILKLFEKELEKAKYHDSCPITAIRMLRIDLLFALTEEKGFKDSDVTTLERQMENDHPKFLSFVHQGTLADACLKRVDRYKEVLEGKEHVSKPFPQLPGYVVLGSNRYKTFLRDEIERLEGESAITLEQSIMELGLRYNLVRELEKDDRTRSEEIVKFKAGLKYFERLKEDAGTESEVRECKARAKYYHDLFLEMSRR
ncbi:hypothetical protein H0H93_005532 [Arthromyces matolae]|nr:hypothetical protein H0H93_005532 [Arthromyces matolae]